MRKGFTVHWNGPPARCVGAEHTRCVAYWRAVRNYHVNTKGWSDIAYSFGVCPHGVRFTGRGWYRLQWANGSDVVGFDDGRDSQWYTVIGFLGEGERPTFAMIHGIKDLIQEGRTSGRCGDRVLPHLDFKVKTCPGPELTAVCRDVDRRPLFKDPPATPAPIPGPTFTEHEDVSTTAYATCGGLDPGGNGYVDVVFDGPVTVVISSEVHVPDPADAGYLAWPKAVGSTIRREDPRIVRVLFEGPPSFGAFGSWVTVA